METEDDSISEELVEAPSTPGTMLRAAREEKRLELAQVAAETRIPIRHLESIERDRFDSLPSRTYALGFSRQYARVVGLDDDAIVALVREEMGDAEAHRTMVGGDMEPGDPAKLPSSGLAWFGGIAALILAVGAIAFFSSYFGTAGPASLIAGNEDASEEAGDQASADSGAEDAASAPSASGKVVFTALDDGVWVRIYEEDGERLYEKLMEDGDTFELPDSATEPRINTALPNLLGITIDGQSVPKLSEDPTVLDGTPVSAAALLARADEDDAPEGS